MAGSHLHRIIPPVLLSRRALVEAGIQFPPGMTEPVTLPLTAEGTTYTMAQVAQFLDGDGHFAIGRWDGSLGIFHFEDSPTQGPMISASAANPEFEGLQMLTQISRCAFVTSRSDDSMTVWSSASGSWSDVKDTATISFDPSLGSANCGTVTDTTTPFLIVGHANGHLTAWTIPELNQVMDVDLKHSPPLNPFNLVNVRGVVPASSGGEAALVITGAEDGYLCVVAVPSGRIVSAIPYNPQAQRGINSIAFCGGDLIVGNCSVGSADSNLWLFTLDSQNGTLAPTDHAELRINPASPQIFNFATIFTDPASRTWLASTEEGAIWMGTISDDHKLQVQGYQPLNGPPLGSAATVGVNGELIVANFNIYEFTLT